MTKFITLLTSMIFALGLTTIANAATQIEQTELFSIQQSDAAPEEGEKKKKEGEEEPDC